MALLRSTLMQIRSFTSGKHFLESWQLKSRAGDVNIDEMKKKVIVLYFSAGWCASCRMFTPKLKEFYDKTKDDIEVIWISRDKTPEDLEEYYKKSLPPWAYVPFGGPTREIMKRYKIGGLPFAFALNSKGDVIEDAAKRKIEIYYGPPQKDLKELVQEWKNAQ